MLIHPQFDPIAVSLGPLAVRWYGLMYLAGFAAFIWLGRRRAAAQSWHAMSAQDIDDLLFETGDKLQPVEIKCGMTFSYDWLDAAKRGKAFAGDAALDPWIIHGGDRSFDCAGGRGFS